MLEKYYKVLDKNDKNELVSCLMKGKDQIKYKVGEWSETTDWGKMSRMGIYICDSIDSAKDYIDKVKKEGIVDVSEWEIYEVECKGEVREFGRWKMCDSVKIIKKAE